ncbi:MAG: hypothetical protein QT02_C0006G0005 [archaeon GW2011_AR9]|nr:MAG: hypothetical protein QT02_C0006G0005 [archaeon GW2011_AR9]MBS3120478.1 hypothetical protein [Candidatus Woesearchaeota archaeon]HIG92650.1 hypothetical protein [Candidatus Woesearchaeota archaeon]HIH12289.1 hypothetical protein [Candidatus Woesearchaeota archaeon]
MTLEIPGYALRAYALLYTKYGTKRSFTQAVLDWITGNSMKKKIFAVLVRAGWIAKTSRDSYICVNPSKVIKGLLEFKVPAIMPKAEKQYAFTGLSAIEIWSDYCYMLRGVERSPYFIEVMKKDLRYWKDFLSAHSVPWYIKTGSTIGEFVILIPVEHIKAVVHEGMMVEPLVGVMKKAHQNEMYEYAYTYMRKKYGTAAESRKRNI